MSVEWLIYLLSVITQLGCALHSVILISGAIIFLGLFIYGFWNAETNNNNGAGLPIAVKKNIKHFGIFLLTCVVLNVFIPSERTLYMIAGVALGKEAMHSEMATKVQKIIELKLNEELDKLTQTEKK